MNVPRQDLATGPTVPNWETEGRQCDEVGSIGVDASVAPTSCEAQSECLSESETIPCVSETDTDTSLSSADYGAPAFLKAYEDDHDLCTDAVGFLVSQPETTSVTVVNSSEVQVGPRLLYNAPVVINQYVTSTTTNLTQTALKAANQGLEDVAVVSSTPPKVLTVNGASSPLLDEIWSWRVLKLSLLVTASILVVCVVLAVALTLTSSSAQSSSTQPPFSEPTFLPAPPDEVDPMRVLPGGHRIYSKQEWGGRPTRARPTDEPPFALPHPTPYVLVSHTAGRPCYDPNLCSRICRDIQDDHMGGQLDSPDIAFNFLVGGDGNVYEGRGWDLSNARKGLNGLLKRTNIDICFLGNFVHDEPTVGQLNAAKELLELGVRLEKLAPDYKLFSHNDTSASLSPGKNIFVHIKDWPHFTLPSEIYTSSV